MLACSRRLWTRFAPVKGLARRWLSSTGFAPMVQAKDLGELGRNPLLPRVWSMEHKGTFTATYVVSDPGSRRAAVVDPCLDYSLENGTYSFETADAIVEFVQEQDLQVERILETHVHADHLTAAQYLKDRFSTPSNSVPVCIGERVKQVQKTFKELYNLPWLDTDGSQFDTLLKEDEQFQLGELQVQVLFTPGHTPACASYHVKHPKAESGVVFTGDTVFHPELGTARVDFPGGSATDMWQSVQRLLALPESTVMCIGHDYPDGDRPFCQYATVAEQRAHNKMVHQGASEHSFTQARNTRDASLAAPRLLAPSLQVNLAGGRIPPAESNGTSFIKLPIRPAKRS